MLLRILVPMDGSPRANQALGYADELATAASASVLAVASDAHAPIALLEQIDLHKPDLVVLTSHLDSHGRHTVLDAVADRVVATGLAPVLLLPSDEQPPARPLRGQNVLVLLDGSALAETALPIALVLAGVLDSEVILFKVVTFYSVPYAVPTELMTMPRLDIQLAWEPSFDVKEAENYLRMTVERIGRQSPGMPIRTLVQVGDLIEQIVASQSASRIGLMVMATHARSGAAEALRGSTAHDVVRATHCPLVLVHPTDATRELCFYPLFH